MFFSFSLLTYKSSLGVLILILCPSFEKYLLPTYFLSVTLVKGVLFWRESFTFDVIKFISFFFPLKFVLFGSLLESATFWHVTNHCQAWWRKPAVLPCSGLAGWPSGPGLLLGLGGRGWSQVMGSSAGRDGPLTLPEASPGLSTRGSRGFRQWGGQALGCTCFPSLCFFT